MSNNFKPYVPSNKSMKEISFKAIFLGIILTVILGSANTYLGMTAGMTVAATFPAAVIAMAFMRLFKGNILEENMARTTGAVGEALAAGAVFVIPAFVMSGVWNKFQYLESTVLMLLGGILGVLFVILLRKTLVEDQSLPYPESKACAEIVKAGQHGATGAGLVFGTMGLAALIEFLKNSKGITIIKDVFKGFINLGVSKVSLLDSESKIIAIKDKIATFTQKGSMVVQSPRSSPAFLGVGYIIGFRLAAITFSGGVFGWLFLMPIALFLMSGDLAYFAENSDWVTIANSAYNAAVKPIAVGGMLVGSFYTLFSMRNSLITGLSKGFKDIKKAGASDNKVERINKDAPFGMVIMAILVLVFAMIIVFQQVIKTPANPAWGGAIVSAIVMAIAGFIFAAVAGYLVGIIGSSSNPISGLALSTLLISALLMVIIGLTGNAGIAATLAVAAVVACSTGVAGDMMQDWKVGHILGGTPWRMQIGGIIGVIGAALVLVLPIMLLDKVPGDPTAHAIGTENLPAPQAGLMSMMAKGIVGGEMAWPLVIAGMFFAVALILLSAPSPMLISVGMYLPFSTTFAIFIGGIVKYFMDKRTEKFGAKKAEAKKLEGKEKTNFIDAMVAKAENYGLLLASGLVAGEALTGILLALLVTIKVNLNELIGNVPSISESPLGVILYFVVFIVLIWVLISIPLKKLRKENN